MMANKDKVVENIVDSNKKACGLFGRAVYVDKAALKLLMDDCLKKKAELARCEKEKEMYKEKAREASEKLKSTTEQLERLAKIFKKARYSIKSDKSMGAYADLALLREMSDRCTMSGDSSSQHNHNTLHTMTRAQQNRNSTQVKKIDMIETEIHCLKDEINRVHISMLGTREVLNRKGSPTLDNKKIGNVESVELMSEIRELSNQLRIAKNDVEKRKKDIEVVRSLLSQIRNNSVNFSNMVTLD